MTQSSSTRWKLGIVSILGVSYAIAAGDRTLAQSITLDGSLGPAGTLTGPTYVIPQEAGQTVDTNLFHSFGQFGLDTGETAIFDSAANIRNILSRVTGGSPSLIDGQILTTSPSVNLFLINPSGVIFGPNASLDIGGTTRGSFVATTVDAISWFNGGQFSATNPGGPSSLLTLVGDPSGFLGSLRPPEPIFSLATLSVYPSQNLLLLGGNVELYGATLSAPGGRVEIGALNGAGTVGLNSDFSLSFPAGLERFDVLVTDGTQIDVQALDSGGNIGINAQNLTILGESAISAGMASGQGLDSSSLAGDITLNATDTIDLGQASKVANNVNTGAIGNSGNINIQAGSLFVSEGAQIQALTFGVGNTGRLAITTDEIFLSGLDSSGNPSGVVNNVEAGAEGNAGTIAINTDLLSISDGGQIQALTRGLGNAGVVDITAGDVVLSGVNNGTRSGIFSTVENTDAQGTGGVIGIQASSLSLLDGAQIQTLTRGQGDAGSVGIDVSNILISGFDPNTGIPSGIFSNVEEGAQLEPILAGDERSFGIIINTDSLLVSNGGSIVADTSGNGTAGVVFINAANDVSVTGIGSKISSNVNSTGVGNGVGVGIFANTISLTDGAEISSSTFGIGDAGEVIIQANDSLALSNSRISTNVNPTGEGDATGVAIATNNLLLEDDAQISSSSFGVGDAGEVIIQANNAVSLANSKILTTVETDAIGNAGAIAVTTGNLSVTDGGQIQALTRGFGNAGVVSVTANDVTLAGVNNNSFSGIYSTIENPETEAIGGRVVIQADSLNILGGAQIQTLTRGRGDPGVVGINADNITVSGFDPNTGVSSAIFSSVERGAQLRPVVEGEERGFGILIGTNSLLVSNGGRIVTDTSGVGTAGVVSIDATGDVTVTGEGSSISSNVNRTGVGNAVSVAIGGKSVAINDGAEVSSSTSGRGNAGGVFVVADTTSLAGGNISTTVEPGAVGNGGAIGIFSNSFLLTDGAVVSADTFSIGDAGNIVVGPFINDDSSSVTNNAIAIRDGGTNISTSVRPGAQGKGGGIALISQTLSITGGGEVIAQTLGQGDAGIIGVNATDSVEISGVAAFPLLADGTIGGFSSGLFSTSEEGATGNGGQIEISTDKLRVIDGATISARSRSAFKGGDITVTARELDVAGGGQLLSTAFSNGDAGNITINVSDRITIAGTDPTYFQRFNAVAQVVGEQGASQTLDTISPASGVFANTDVGSTGDGGSIFIDPEQLTISDGARVSVASLGQGNGGNLQIQAQNLTLDRDGAIEATTASGEGGNIDISARDLLLLRRNSNISTAAGGSGNGGNIGIDTTFIVAQPFEDSNIIADAIAGRGGNIDISAQGIFGIQSRPRQTPRSDITASSQLGINGTIQINTPDVDPSQGLVALPVDTVDASNQIATGCTNSDNAANQNRFTVTGRGGLPPNPGDTLAGEEVLTDWATLEESEVKTQPTNTNSSRDNSPTQQVVEAQGWVIDAQGKVILTAQAPTVTPNSNKFSTSSCQKS